MKMCHLIPFLLVALLLSACGTSEKTSSGTTASLEDFSVKNTEASITEGDFIYRLVSEQEEYTSGGPVEIYAELEYTGDQKTIDIFHAASPFYFPIEEKTRNYEIHYAMNEPLLTTTLTKGEPLREKYVGSGGYSADEEDAYIEFTQKVMNNEFPEGYYVVSGYTDFYTETPDGNKTDYEIQAEIDFKVVAK